jgi:hypothetical protein
MNVKSEDECANENQNNELASADPPEWTFSDTQWPTDSNETVQTDGQHYPVWPKVRRENYAKWRRGKGPNESKPNCRSGTT